MVVIMFALMVLLLLVLCVALAWQVYGRDIRAYQYIHSLDSARQEAATNTRRRNSDTERASCAQQLRQRSAFQHSYASSPQTKELLKELDRMK
mmetsp:Transcript_2301/g.8194  ORF Transcript_2301/g.8194 Transcript_2301/m.8194 type:complete len:93 (+) Transcript_2301:235-513(+)